MACGLFRVAARSVLHAGLYGAQGPLLRPAALTPQRENPAAPKGRRGPAGPGVRAASPAGLTRAGRRAGLGGQAEDRRQGGGVAMLGAGPGGPAVLAAGAAAASRSRTTLLHEHPARSAGAGTHSTRGHQPPSRSPPPAGPGELPRASSGESGQRKGSGPPQACRLLWEAEGSQSAGAWSSGSQLGLQGAPADSAELLFSQSG